MLDEFKFVRLVWFKTELFALFFIRSPVASLRCAEIRRSRILSFYLHSTSMEEGNMVVPPWYYMSH